MQAPIMQLPNELLLQILSVGCQVHICKDTPWNDQPRRYEIIEVARQVCRHWRYLVDCPHKSHFWSAYLSLCLNLLPDSEDGFLVNYPRVIEQMESYKSQGCCIVVKLSVLTYGDPGSEALVN